ncbi:CCR4-NOT transcription complex subunit 10 [Cocos nucifera]|uniref:CCR4-NOT transcription complex subunit 10 n=1 Tax=Cocos nucifera TaxID=13894 RepID=A0A8K0HWD7_COCNU|nr:CCR4-NOT transcription complex subunit 10 [Cocos nucifera]
MDAREPSASSVSPAAGGKDGLANEEGPLSDAEELAKEAAALFQSRRFSECIDVLNQLLQKKGEDPKVLHNIAVAEYFHDGCSDPAKLLDVLNKVKKRSEDLAHASVERMEVGSDIDSNTTSGSKVNNTILLQVSAPNTGNISYPDEYDTSVVMLNIAVILYHLHEYALALSVLEPLYQNIEPINEATALHVCLLLLDVALACQDASKAADVIQYLEKSFGAGHMINQLDNGSIAQHHSNQGLKVSTSNTTAPDVSGSDSSGSANVPDNALARTLSDDTLEYETLYSTLDTGSQNFGRPASSDCSNSSVDQAATAIDLKLNLHLYKVRLLLLTRNLKAAKREVKLAMNVARCRDSSTALLLKAQLEYARGNHRKAIKLLMTSGNRTEAGALSMFNNLGCIYHQFGKHNISTLSFSKALKSSMLLRSEKPLKLSTFSQDKSLVIMYNCGLQYLACGKPLVAAHCFNKARSIFFNRPLLWLRLAECCLSALEKGLLQPSSSSSSGGEEVKVHVVGRGRWRQLVIDDKNPKYWCLDDSGDGVISPDGPYKLSLPFARQCLLNALHLLNNFELTKSSANSEKEDDSNQTISLGGKNLSNKNSLAGDSKSSNATSASTPAGANDDSKEVKGGTSSNSTLQSSVSAYEDTCKKVNNLIKQAVLGDLAYVELSLENPLKALAAAQALQQLPDCSRIYGFLSHVYAAEALCHLNRPKEAAEHLSIYISDKNEVQLPYSDEDRDKWRIEKGGDGEEVNGHLNAKTCSEEPQGMVFLKPEEARGALYVNLATMSIIQGDHEQASRFLREALSLLPNNPRATLAAIYVDILLGRIQDALVKLKQSRHVRFFPGGVKLSSTC